MCDEAELSPEEFEKKLETMREAALRAYAAQQSAHTQQVRQASLLFCLESKFGVYII